MDNEMIRAIAALADAVLWPILVFLLVLIYRENIGNLIDRIKRGKILGQEIELSEQLDEIQENLEQIEQYEEAVEMAESDPTTAAVQDKSEYINQIIEDIGSADPKAALRVVLKIIEKEIYLLLSAYGKPPVKRKMGLPSLTIRLSNENIVPDELVKSIYHLDYVVGKIFDEEQVVSKSDLDRAAFLSISVMSALQSIPRQECVVVESGLQLYSDEKGEHPIRHYTGLLLDIFAPRTKHKDRKIFPVVGHHYRPGMKLSWEWDPGHRIGEAFYRDPQSGQIRRAWGSSMLFDGEPLLK